MHTHTHMHIHIFGFYGMAKTRSDSQNPKNNRGNLLFKSLRTTGVLDQKKKKNILSYLFQILIREGCPTSLNAPWRCLHHPVFTLHSLCGT